MSARTRPQASTQKIVIGIYARNFPMIHGKNIIGIKATMVVMTHEIIGIAYSFKASIIALSGSYQILIFALAACTITIIVSTAIQKERIREKFVKKFSVKPP